jgi:hypothetical protein
MHGTIGLQVAVSTCMTTIDQLRLAAVSGATSRSNQCSAAWGADLASARQDWGHTSAAYFFAAHPDPATCAAGKQPVSSYYGPTAAARAVSAGIPKYPVR